MRPLSRFRSLAALGLGLVALALSTPALAAGKTSKKEPEPKLPDAPARLWIVAPSAEGLWTMRIDNEGTEPLRVPADVRLLSFELDTHQKGKRPLKCSAPRALRPSSFPESRAVLLAPGQSYVERFDPRLLCFGKLADGLAGSVVVKTTFGWDPPSKWSKKPPSAPFAVEGTSYPAKVAPRRQLVAPTMVLSFAKPEPPKPADDDGDDDDASAETEAQDDADAKDEKAKGAAPADAKPPQADAKSDDARSDDAKRSAKKDDAKSDGSKQDDAKKDDAKKDDDDQANAKPAIVDENAARLEVELGDYADASAARDVRIDARLVNAGHRPMVVALRPRMLSFRVTGPTGRQSCDAAPPTQAMPRESFRSLKPGDKVTFSILLAEQCPELKLDRPGLYHVDATLHALERGEALHLEAYTGIVQANDTALVRIASGPRPFYKGAPAAVPTPKPEPVADEAD